MLKYNVAINEYEIRDGKVFYLILINGPLNQQKQIEKRYSDLKVLNDKIAQKNIDFKLHLTLPAFPGRKFFGRTNKSVEDIRARGKELQYYLEQLININQLWSFQSIREILPKDNEIDQSMIMETSDKEYSNDLYWKQMDELKRSYLEKHYQITPKKGKVKSSQQINGYLQRYHFNFDDYLLQQDYVTYSILLCDNKKTTKYMFTARYSDLREYHTLLEKKQFKHELPHFPKRKLIGQTNDNPVQIQERLEQLQKYFNDVFSVKEFVESEAMTYFITKIKLEGKSIKFEESRQGSQQGMNSPSVLYLSPELSSHQQSI